tara:strand:- start:176 stop:682 length:507 start_codon:yes stop_codon:yes gene_type:complete
MYTPGKSKEYIRDGVFHFFKECKHIITLPNLYFGLEQRFLDEGIKVDCSEYKVNTFKGAVQLKPKDITLFNTNVKYLNLSKYDGLFFDLYGTWNKSMEESLPRINKNARLVITFLMGREHLNLQKIIDIKHREESYVKLLSKYGFKTIKYINYCDTTPMCVFYCIKIR